MTHKAKITIGIPTRNRADMLAMAIQSAVSQTYDGVEVVVSDNASVDVTPEVVARWPGVRYSRNQIDRGAVANFQRLLELANTEYFSLLQDDDLIFPDFARRAMAAFESDERIVAYCAYAAEGATRDQLAGHRLYGPPIALDWWRREPRAVDGRIIGALSLFCSFAIPPVIVFRTDLFRSKVPWCNFSRYPLVAERVMLAAVAAEGLVAVDPYLGGVFNWHEEQFSRLAIAADSQWLSREWPAFTEDLAEIASRDPNPTSVEVLTPFLVEMRREQLLNWLTKTEIWPRSNPFCLQVRDLLRSTAAKRDLLDGKRFSSDARRHVRLAAKGLARSVTPPVLWHLLSRAKTRWTCARQETP